jgi:murein DD-endopeptidase MepM/ murein hydrolase activator NlpD
VRAGEIIGYAATAEPHLRFEIWQRGELGDVAIEPLSQLKTWTISPDAGVY